MYFINVVLLAALHEKINYKRGNMYIIHTYEFMVSLQKTSTFHKTTGRVAREYDICQFWGTIP